ncbi:hypothetical protein F1D15_23690, partial [Salmonella enterica subsp. enterica serovar Kentucky]|nr:hypothetical protein [Salmonella enterica subsp. enterica serovar Kentucky]
MQVSLNGYRPACLPAAQARGSITELIPFPLLHQKSSWCSDRQKGAAFRAAPFCTATFSAGRTSRTRKIMRRLPVFFVLDCSESMIGENLKKMTDGLQ